MFIHRLFLEGINSETMESIFAHLSAAKEHVTSGMQFIGKSSQTTDPSKGPNSDLLQYQTPPPPPPPTSPYPITPELADVPYNQLQQVSSHNSYQTEVHGDMLIGEQFEQHGIHSFELDIHNGDAPVQLIGDNRLEDDYHVYHDTSDTILPPWADDILGSQGLGSGSNYASLTAGLDDVYKLDNEMPVTLFVDVKDTLEGDHGPDLLNDLINGGLREKVFTPQDLMDWAGTDNLQDAVAHGWPTAEELNGRVIVVLTGDLSGYTAVGDNPAAFIAPEPQFQQTYTPLEEGSNEGFLSAPEFSPDPDAVFYNTKDPSLAGPVHDDGYSVRVYDFETPNADAQATDANHLGTNEIDPDHNNYPESPEDTNPFNVLDPAENQDEEIMTA